MGFYEILSLGELGGYGCEHMAYLQELVEGVKGTDISTIGASARFNGSMSKSILFYKTSIVYITRILT
jgi:hypothetical protein